MIAEQKPTRKVLTLKKKAAPPPAPPPPPPAEDLRLFVAVAADAAWLDFRSRAARALAPGLKDLRHRFISPSNLHLTVRFLGKIPHADLDKITAAVAAAAAANKPFVLEDAGLIASPRPNKPRMIWAAFPKSPAFSRLAASCEKALAPHLPPPPEKPKKHRDRTDPGDAPHITVAHLKKAKPPFYERPLVESAIATVKPPPPPLPVSAIVLIKSELRSDAARYTLIQSFPLTGTKTATTPAAAKVAKKAAKPAAKKTAVKKPAAKKTAKPAAKKAVKPAAKKAAAKKVMAKKVMAKKAVIKKPAAKKSAVKKTAIKKPATKKAKPAARKARKS